MHLAKILLSRKQGMMERGGWQLLRVSVQREECLGGWVPIFKGLGGWNPIFQVV